MRWLWCLVLLISCAPHRRVAPQFTRPCAELESSLKLAMSVPSPRRIAVTIATVGKSAGRTTPTCPGEAAHFAAALREDLGKAGFEPVEIPPAVSPRDLAMIGASKLLRGTVTFTTHDPDPDAGEVPLHAVDGNYTLMLVDLEAENVIATSVGVLNGTLRISSPVSVDDCIRQVVGQSRETVVRPFLQALARL